MPHAKVLLKKVICPISCNFEQNIFKKKIIPWLKYLILFTIFICQYEFKLLEGILNKMLNISYLLKFLNFFSIICLFCTKNKKIFYSYNTEKHKNMA